MQATVETFDPATGAGTMLTDEGRRIGFDRAAVDRGGLRHVRPGQRVHVDRDNGDETVTAIRIF